MSKANCLFIVTCLFLAITHQALAGIKPVDGLRDYNGTYYGVPGTGSIGYTTLYLDNYLEAHDPRGSSGCNGETCGRHPGVDIPVPSGTEVKAPFGGEVIRADCDTKTGWGGLVMIRFYNPYQPVEILEEVFAHNRKLLVKKGDIVKAGDVVALSGGDKNDYCPGTSTASHVHYQIDKSNGDAKPYSPSGDWDKPDPKLAATTETYNPIPFTVGQYFWSFGKTNFSEYWSAKNAASSSVESGFYTINAGGGFTIERFANTNCEFTTNRQCSGKILIPSALFRYIYLMMEDQLCGTPHTFRVYFTTATDSNWTESKSVAVQYEGPGVYEVKMSDNSNWNGIVTGLRIAAGNDCSSIRSIIEQIALSSFQYNYCPAPIPDGALQASLFCGGGKPDLVVTNVTSPSTGSAGSTINVSVSIANNGQVNAGTFSVGFYLSVDNTITTADKYTGWSCTWAGLQANATSGCGGNITIPSDVASGGYYFGAYIDDSNKVDESDESNNGRAAMGMITIAGTGGTPGSFSLGVTPQCSGSYPEIRLNWTASNLAEAYDIYRDGSLLIGGLSSSQLQYVNTTVSAGTKYIYFLRAKNTKGFTDSTTVEATAPTNCGPSLPDLTVTQFTAPAVGQPGGQINISVSIQNLGAVDSPPFVVAFYISTDATVTRSDINTGWTCNFTGGLQAGGSTGCGGNIGVPASLPPGDYHIGAFVDDGLVVTEINENNNGGAAPNKTAITPFAWEFPDLQGWIPTNAGASTSGGIVYFDPQKTDPYFTGPNIFASASVYHRIRVRVASNALDGDGFFFFKTSTEDFYDEIKKVAVPLNYCPKCTNAPYYEYEVLMSTNAKWNGTITGIRFDPADTADSSGLDIIGIDYIRLVP